MIPENLKIFFSDQLVEISSLLSKEELSVLIGAGFSKNVNEQLFKNWKDLLFTIAYQVIEKKLENDYRYERSFGNQGSLVDFQKYAAERVHNYIDQNGYLKTVSNYIAFVGYREAVDLYIEQETPFAQADAGKNYLTVFDGINRNKKCLLLDSDLRIHQRLLSLPWNNIFTTNYDNLLEFCNEQDQSIVIDLKNSYSDQISQNKMQISKHKDDIEKLKKKNEKLKAEESVNFSSVTSDLSTNNSSEDEVPYDQSQENSLDTAVDDQTTLKNIKDLEYAVSRLIQRNSEIKQKLNRLISGNPRYTVVKNSYDLELNRSRNIIKLHGSIREKFDHQFGFDNDFNKCYVISAEDYTDYPLKHEAFTQLMRISLLQGCFCVIGFSGDDPNFLAWLKWVRDIVTKRRTSSDSMNELDKKPKIYFIDVRGKEIADSRRQQFYHNHKIVHLPISHPEFLAIMEERLGVMIDPTDNRNVLHSFFDLIDRSGKVNSMRVKMETLLKEHYESSNNGLSKIDRNSSVLEINSFYENFVLLKPLKLYVTVPSFEFSIDFAQRRFLQSFKTVFDDHSNDRNLKIKLLDVFVDLVNDIHLPHYFYMSTEDIMQEVENLPTEYGLLAEKLMLVILKGAVATSSLSIVDGIGKKLIQSAYKEVSQEASFLVSYYYLFSWEIGALKSILRDWRPEGKWVSRKNAISLHLGLEITESSDTIDNLPTLQEQLLAMEIIETHKYGKEQYSSKQSKISRFKAQKIRSINDALKTLASNVQSRDQRVLPKGVGKYNIRKSETFSNISPELSSIQLFFLLIDTGFPMEGYAINVIKPENLLLIMQSAFRFMPLPVLFYLLKNGDRQFVARMAQEYVTTTEIDEDQSLLVNALEKAFLYNCNEDLQVAENVLVFLAEYVNVIEADRRNALFSSIWVNKRKRKKLFEDEHHTNKSFVESGLKLISDIKLFKMVLSDLISDYNSKDSFSCISYTYLYALVGNPLFITLENEKTRSSISKQLDGLVSIALIKSEHLFVVSWLWRILDARQRETVVQSLPHMDLFHVNDLSIFHIVLLLSGYDGGIKRKIKRVFISHQDLWNAGIKPQYISSGIRHIRLRDFRLNKWNRKGLSFTKKEVQKLFEALRESFLKIQEVLLRRGDLNFILIVREMVWFLEDEKYYLSDEETYQSTLESLRELSQKYRDNLTCFQSLSSDAKEVVNLGIMEVSKNLYDAYAFSSEHNNILVIVHRILRKDNVASELCLEYFSRWAMDFRKLKAMLKFKDLLLEILAIYSKGIPSFSTHHLVEADLVRIAYVLNSWGEKHDLVLRYLDLLQTSRYNTINWVLRAELQAD